MMDLGTIRALNHDVGNRAKRQGIKTWHPETLEDISISNLRRIPLMGDYVPKRYEVVTRFFVDKTGLDNSGHALSVEGLLRAMRDDFSRNPTHSYGLTDEGQFQIYVTVYDRRQE